MMVGLGHFPATVKESHVTCKVRCKCNEKSCDCITQPLTVPAPVPGLRAQSNC